MCKTPGFPVNLLFSWGLMAWAMSTGGCVTGPHEPANLDPLKQEIRIYVDSGGYDRDIAAVAAKATAWLEERAARRTPGERLALVLDLDETLLSDLAAEKENDFGGSDATWAAWLAMGDAPAIGAVRAVYRRARQLHIEVFLLTGRAERDRPPTEKNLVAIGCNDYAGLIMKPNDDRRPVAAFKTGERKRLTAAGRAIVANIGDQESDLAGGYAERTFKLPNPFYLTP